MLRTQLARATRIPIRAVMATRSVADNAGSIGGTRPGGVQSSDSFNKREKAAEDMREAEKLKELRETLARQRENLDEIEKHIDMIERDAKVPVAKKEEGKE